MKRSWSETQAMAERAACGAEVPFAQAARFGAAAACHLAAGRDPAEIGLVLAAPDALVRLSLAVERLIERASMKPGAQEMAETPRDLALSYIESMPCAALVERGDTALHVNVDLASPAERIRPARVDVPDDLWAQMEMLAARTYVPDSAASREQGAGAGLMDLD